MNSMTIFGKIYEPSIAYWVTFYKKWRIQKMDNKINKGKIVIMTTPWCDTPKWGKIIEVFETKVGNYYVVEFDDGTTCTAKESDLQ